MSKLFLSSPLDFNDPFDMLGRVVVNPTTEERISKINELISQNGIKFKDRKKFKLTFLKKNDQQIADDVKAIYHDARRRTGVFSFGGDPRNILMWSHYSQNHSGICLQFETARDFMVFGTAVKVEYSEHYPIIRWISKDFSEDMKRVILRKHHGWSHEKESRIVRPRESHSYIRFDPSSLVGIILGCRITSEKINILDELLDERRNLGLPNINIYTAVQHESDYKLIIKKHKG